MAAPSFVGGGVGGVGFEAQAARRSTNTPDQNNFLCHMVDCLSTKMFFKKLSKGKFSCR